jgi:outer membrane protein OmpA-like peptidoglycan-associated protein
MSDLTGQRRSAADWRAYDRANLVIVALLAALCAVSWWNWRGQTPAAARSGERAGGTPLELYAARGWVRLTGAVPDEPAHQALLRGAATAFGEDRVIDQLVVRGDAPALAWLPRAGELFISLRASVEPTGVRIDGGQVTLSGTVPQEFMVAGLEAQARQWFGPAARIDNLLKARASAEAASAPPPVAADSAPQPAASVPSLGAATTIAAAASGADNKLCAQLAQGVAIAFVPGQPQLAPEGQRHLAEVARCLGGSEQWRVGGHTDANGPEARNLQLTQARAEQVVAQLVSLGIAADRLQAQGHGSTQPLGDNRTREGRLANRRISFERAP